MTALKTIINYLDAIVKYYLTLRGTDNILDFLRIELKCINEALALIDLTVLPLSEEYINKCRQTAYNALEDNKYLEITKKLHAEIVDKIFKIKRYTQMSEHEQAVYESFMLLFAIEIEPGDLMIEIFTDAFLCCTIDKEKDFINILEKYFKEIIKNN
jgi:hypothetical protein